MNKRKRWILGGLAAALALLLVLGAWWLRGGPQLWTQRQFSVHRAAFADTAEAALAGEPWKNVPGVRNVNVWPKAGTEDVELADFTTGAWGLGSSTRYWGIYCTTDGGPAGFQGTDMELTEDAPGQFSWQETGGDNSYQTWELDDGWYGYLMEF